MGPHVINAMENVTVLLAILETTVKMNVHLEHMVRIVRCHVNVRMGLIVTIVTASVTVLLGIKDQNVLMNVLLVLLVRTVVELVGVKMVPSVLTSMDHVHVNQDTLERHATVAAQREHMEHTARCNVSAGSEPFVMQLMEAAVVLLDITECSVTNLVKLAFMVLIVVRHVIVRMVLPVIT